MATFTSAGLVTEVGKQLQDTANITWTAATIYEYATRTQRVIRNRRPDAMCTESSISYAAPGTVDAATNPTIDDRFFMAMVHYICFLCLSEDADDEENKRLADAHFNHYAEEIS
jgi:hypothetical protein